jgi:L-alanine-DL-glutamate epimerase-like enolase superfamily enzyme
MYMGGLWRTLQVADAAAARAGLPCTPHCAWQVGLFRGDPFAITDGHVLVPDQPGWGIEIEPGWLDSSVHLASGTDERS